VFLVVNLALLQVFGLLPNAIALNTSNQVDVLLGTTLIGLISWISGVFLLVVNRDILRLMEGYGRFNPFRLPIFFKREKHRFQELKAQIKKLDNEYRECIKQGTEFPAASREKRNRAMERAVERFPNEEQWVLPTSFGNTIRAFEVYPKVMYGLDAIPGWNRLLGVIPKEYSTLINDAKAQVDFWVNLWVLSIILILEYAIAGVVTSQFKLWWFPILMLAVTFVAYARARVAAIEWGDLIKAAFDIYLPELSKKLGFEKPANRDEEIALWHKVSQSIIYAKPEYMPPRYTEKEETEEQKTSK
jgi:hypothetical protein